MQPLYTQEEYNNVKGRAPLKMICDQCQNVFTSNKSHISQLVQTNAAHAYCSVKCQSASKKQVYK